MSLNLGCLGPAQVFYFISKPSQGQGQSGVNNFDETYLKMCDPNMNTVSCKNHKLLSILELAGEVLT